MPQAVPRFSVVGNRRVTDFLERVQARQAIAHAYLFLGPASVGKRTVVGFFLSGILGRPWQPSQDLSAFLSYPDFFLLARERDEKTDKPKKNITIEQVRAMREKLSMGSLLGSWKVAVIDGAEHLSGEAANALLKTIEEPAPKTLIILIADQLGGLPQTVLSRVQQLRFSLVPTNEIMDGLLAAGAGRADAELLAGQAVGRPGLAFRLLGDSEAQAESAARMERAVAALSMPVYERFTVFAKALPERASLVEQAEAARGVLVDCTLVLRDALSLAWGEPGRTHVRSSQHSLAPYVQARSAQDIGRTLRLIRDLHRGLSLNMQPKIILESLALAL